MNRANLLKLSVLTMVLLIISSSVFAEAPQNTGTVLDLFLEPDVHAKPMARMWFPDAGAGEDDNDLIDKQISGLAARGFGGVEVAMLMSNGVRYSNDEARIYGWGTDNWIRLLKKVLTAAAKIPGGFQVDLTVTAHWPPVLNTIDPNDDAANKEMSFSVTPITAEDLASGTIRLALPEQKTNGPANTFGPPSYSHFLFTDQFVSATVAQIAEVVSIPGETGEGDRISYIFDFGS